MDEELNLTRVLNGMKSGDEAAFEKAYRCVEAELRRIARRQLKGSRGDVWQTTALLDEAFVRLRGSPNDIESRGHFMGLAAKVMRNILVDHVRERNRDKRRPEGDRVLLDAIAETFEKSCPKVIELDEALTELGSFDPELLEVVELRYFGGLSVPEIAELLGVSKRTIERRWTLARNWLWNRLQ